ncbi:MAG: recombination regulator RecX [Chlorobiaceae bacterium]
MLKTSNIDLQNAMHLALKLLGIRSHSREELKQKLLKKGYTIERIEPVLEKLTTQDLLDDYVFGSELIRSYSKRKPVGKLKIRNELRKKGVSETIIVKLLNEYNNLTHCWLAAEKKVRTLHGTSKPNKKIKLARFLHNRGFEWQEIQPVIKHFFKDSSEFESLS